MNAKSSPSRCISKRFFSVLSRSSSCFTSITLVLRSCSKSSDAFLHRFLTHLNREFQNILFGRQRAGGIRREGTGRVIRLVEVEGGCAVGVERRIEKARSRIGERAGIAEDEPEL